MKKTLRKNEKLLVKSYFSFPHSVFKRLVLQTRKNQGSFGKGLRFQIEIICCGRPLLQAWLLPDLNTLTIALGRILFKQLSGYGIGFSSRHPWFTSYPDILFLPCIYSFLALLRTSFVRIHTCISAMAEFTLSNHAFLSFEFLMLRTLFVRWGLVRECQIAINPI